MVVILITRSCYNKSYYKHHPTHPSSPTLPHLRICLLGDRSRSGVMLMSVWWWVNCEFTVSRMGCELGVINIIWMYLNKMSSVLTNLSVIQKLARDLVQAKHLNYSEECIRKQANNLSILCRWIQIHHLAYRRPEESFRLCSQVIPHQASSHSHAPIRKL